MKFVMVEESLAARLAVEVRRSSTDPQLRQWAIDVAHHDLRSACLKVWRDQGTDHRKLDALLEVVRDAVASVPWKADGTGFGHYEDLPVATYRDEVLALFASIEAEQ